MSTHLHWPSLVHRHYAGATPHAHVVEGGCRNMPDTETILFEDDIPDGQVGRFFNICPLHGAPDAA